MSKDSDTLVESQAAPAKINIAGFDAHRSFAPSTPIGGKSQEDLDLTNLVKARSAGLPITSLDELGERYKIFPVRTPRNIAELLGYDGIPRLGRGETAPHLYTEAHTTALAFPYPDISKPNDTYPYQHFMRIRYATKAGRGESASNYGQRRKDKSISTREPYFLIIKETWDKLYSNCDLIHTEGELKSVAVGLTGEACLGYPGCNMWMAPEKSGKNRLHPSIDPTGPWKKYAIPIKDRTHYILPDSDWRSNQAVESAFKELSRALFRVNVPSVRMMRIPEAPAGKNWKGVDDYLFSLLGPAWAANHETLELARSIIKELKDNSEPLSPRQTYPSLSIPNTAERLGTKLVMDSLPAVVTTYQNCYGVKTHALAIYNGERYIPEQLWHGSANASGKVKVTSDKLLNCIAEEHEESNVIAFRNGEIDEPVPMPTDFAQSLMPELIRIMPHHELNTFTEYPQGFDDGDKCIAIRGALINLTKFFEDSAWDRRDKWLLPPSKKWISYNRLNVSLTNLSDLPVCPMFLDMITHAFDGDQESIDCLQIALGKLITSPLFVNRQRFLSMYGIAGSGKSTTIELMTEMIDKTNIASLDCDSDSRFAASELPGKTLILFRDTEEHFSVKMGSLIKKIIGEEDIRVERKHAHEESMRIRAEIVTIGNDPPVIPMDGLALDRRAIFIKFVNQLKERNHTAKPYMISKELSGVFMWAMAGAAKLYNGAELITPKMARGDLQDIVDDISPEKQFVLGEVVKKDGAVLTTTKLLEGYQLWLAERRKSVTKLSIRKLCRCVREQFKIDTEVKREGEDTVRAFFGVTLKNFSRF